MFLPANFFVRHYSYQVKGLGLRYLPRAYRQSLVTFLKPGGKGEEKFGPIKHLRILHRGPKNVLHASSYDNADARLVVLA
ncbi:hypothetical protein G6O67_006212 [Ophiocordyceps sinensis]|uniref:Uncharacterized protein n=1 Tax=Ophiocordyceps sinensis TaxID=72228 RepID=A0A8H4PLV4_9HYPO|nr:hypothetical protein G6O67_006212 [Ophiocordyceps sinensis]